jgi:hypothetical protein
MEEPYLRRKNNDLAELLFMGHHSFGNNITTEGGKGAAHFPEMQESARFSNTCRD